MGNLVNPANDPNLVRVLCIDPSLNNFGLVVLLIDIRTFEIRHVERMKLVRTESQAGKQVRKNSDDLRRAQELRAAMVEMAQGCTLAFVEVPSGSQSARGSFSNGISVGVIAGCPVPMIEVLPNEVKLATVGRKTATKEEMIAWAHTRFPGAEWIKVKRKGVMELTKANEHLADGICIGFTGAQTAQFRQAVAMLRSMQNAA